ncbi:uncharacterized protein LOC115442892 isoform X2 [Manduca sexta]|uniref:Uncharacterized protein n=2 Tax=Manduca sexta TaxID=7130 RepID=A0A921Z0L3_MANSE|nr:uncharacterized protein LOC115442892 isoform X2 [Manduca sexta]KAG6449142.1 hypothetical protein O3G_MSEX005906 [Manduca sexta]
MSGGHMWTYKLHYNLTMCRSPPFMLYFSWTLLSTVLGHGLLLLYRPRDISNECAFSHRLRYDLSFGMGMSDTITLVFRTLSEIDYECSVEIAAQSDQVFLLVVIKFPGNIGPNCAVNQNAFTVIKKNMCLRLCDSLGERDVHSPYFVVPVRGRIRFRFLSNSSINSDINANLYQVTATSARQRPKEGCFRGNETICTVSGGDFCFSSGVVCDGIKNCGVSDWFDERKSECSLPIEKLGYAPVIAVVAAILCAVMAACHTLLRCLPPLANSFFIFNANEDNRLCIDPVFKPPDVTSYNVETARKISLIPVFSSSSSFSTSDNNETTTQCTQSAYTQPTTVKQDERGRRVSPRKKTIVRTFTEQIHQKIRIVTGRKKGASKEDPETRKVTEEADCVKSKD